MMAGFLGKCQEYRHHSIFDSDGAFRQERGLAEGKKPRNQGLFTQLSLSANQNGWRKGQKWIALRLQVLPTAAEPPPKQ